MTKRNIPGRVAARVRQTAGNRCGYCLASQPYFLHVLEIEHIVPTARGGDDSEENLWLACRMCNNAKGAKAHGHDSESNRVVPFSIPAGSGGAATSDGVRTACG